MSVIRSADGRRPGLGLALAVIATAQLMVVLDATIVNVALPHIQRTLGFSGNGLEWVVNAYALSFGGLMLLGGRAGDLLGRRRVFISGLVLLSAASLAGGFASSQAWLLAARAIQGIGGALTAPTALALIATTCAEGPARNRAMSVVAAMSGGGAAVGLVAGGLLTTYLSCGGCSSSTCRSASWPPRPRRSCWPSQPGAGAVSTCPGPSPGRWGDRAGRARHRDLDSGGGQRPQSGRAGRRRRVRPRTGAGADGLPAARRDLLQRPGHWHLPRLPGRIGHRAGRPGHRAGQHPGHARGPGRRRRRACGGTGQLEHGRAVTGSAVGGRSPVSGENGGRLPVGAEPAEIPSAAGS